MATVSNLVDSLINRLHEPDATVRQKIRNLQDQALLPVASGRFVPSVTVKDVALSIIAIATSPNIKDAAKFANLYSRLTVFKPHEAYEHDHFLKNVTAEQFLEHALTKLGSPHQDLMFLHADAKYEFCLTWPEIFATVPAWEGEERLDDVEFRFVLPDHDGSHWRSRVKKSISISGIALAYIAVDLNIHDGEMGELVQ